MNNKELKQVASLVESLKTGDFNTAKEALSQILEKKVSARTGKTKEQI
jgi:hypothetical protein